MRKFTNVMLSLSLLMTAAVTVTAQRITVTLAGNGTAGYSGDGGAGKLSTINQPNDVVTNTAGDVYFTDQSNGRVRKIAAKDGKLTTVAGGGSSSADGIPAVNASITPVYLCLDAAGNIYFSERAMHRIRKVNATTHIITTIAGTGTVGYSGDGGPAISATFNTIQGIAADAAGNIYLADQLNNRIRKVDASSGIVTTVAGTGTAGFAGDGSAAVAALLSKPVSICAGPTGDVFFTDQGGGTYMSRIRKITAASGVITTIAGTPSGGDIFDMPALSTWLGEVTGLCMDGSGDLYCNEISCSCRRMSMLTDSIYAVGGNFSIEGYGENVNSLIAYMNNPYGLCADAAGNIYSADKFNNRIRKMIQLTSTPTYAYGKGGYIKACPSSSISFDSLLTITDLEAGQTETWSVITAPAHGSVTGFPATASSAGTNGVSYPTGVAYTLTGAYSGLDSFQVMVSDGVLSDIMTVYVSAGAGPIDGPGRVCAGATVTFTGETDGGAWSTSNANASVSSTGDVTGILSGSDIIYYALTNICGLVTTERTIDIDVAPPVTAGTLSGVVPNICAGSTITLSSSVAGGVWGVSNSTASITPDGILAGVTAGTDSVIYTVTNGCGPTSIAVALNINTYPVAGTITGDDNVFAGSSLMLANSAPGGVWSSSNNSIATVSSAGQVFGVAPGTDNISYQVTNVCGTATTSHSVTVFRSTLGIGNVTHTGAGMTVSPNPATSQFAINVYSASDEDVTVTITNVAGDQIKVFKGTTNHTIDAGLNVPAGLYQVNAVTAHNNMTSKLVIE